MIGRVNRRDVEEEEDPLGAWDFPQAARCQFDLAFSGSLPGDAHLGVPMAFGKESGQHVPKGLCLSKKLTPPMQRV